MQWQARLQRPHPHPNFYHFVQNVYSMKRSVIMAAMAESRILFPRRCHRTDPARSPRLSTTTTGFHWVQVAAMAEINTIKELDGLKSVWTKGVAQLQKFIVAAKTCPKKLKGCIANAKRAELRRLGDTSAAAAEEIKKLAESRRRAAAAIKAEETAVPNLYLFEGIPEVGRSNCKTILQELAEPHVFSELCADKDWKADAKLQLCLGNYGGTYKRSTTFKDTSKNEEVVKKEDGRAEVMDMIKSFNIFSPESIAEEPDDSQLKWLWNSVFLWGYNPRARFQGATCNGVAQLKVQISGTLRHFVFSTRRLPGDLRQGFVSGIVTRLSQLSSVRIKALSDEGVIKQATLQPWEMLYIPAGSLVFEATTSGTLVSGLRRTVMLCDQQSASQYETLINIYKESRTSDGKMEEVLAVLQSRKRS